VGGALVCLAGSDDGNCGSGGSDCASCGTGTHCDGLTNRCVPDSTDLASSSTDLACMRSSSPAVLGACSVGSCANSGYVCALGACHKRCLTDCDCPIGTLCQAGPSSNYCS
jgi:hypothetical protein